MIKELHPGGQLVRAVHHRRSPTPPPPALVAHGHIYRGVGRRPV